MSAASPFDLNSPSYHSPLKSSCWVPCSRDYRQRYGGDAAPNCGQRRWPWDLSHWLLDGTVGHNEDECALDDSPVNQILLMACIRKGHVLGLAVELLKGDISYKLKAAEVFIERWRRYYKPAGSHSSPGYLRPVEFVRCCGSYGRAGPFVRSHSAGQYHKATLSLQVVSAAGVSHVGNRDDIRRHVGEQVFGLSFQDWQRSERPAAILMPHVCCALKQPVVDLKDIVREGPRPRRTPQQQRNLAIGTSMFGETIVDDEHIAPELDGVLREPRPRTVGDEVQPRRVFTGGHHHHGIVYGVVLPELRDDLDDRVVGQIAVKTVALGQLIRSRSAVPSLWNRREWRDSVCVRAERLWSHGSLSRKALSV